MDTESSEFFLVALPGLEDIVGNEIKDWYPELEPKIEYGGITVHTDLPKALSMNLVLKTPTRILWRIDSFKARDFPKLYNKLKKMDWSQYLDTQCDLDIQVSTRLSRLSIKSRIEKTCLDAWYDYRKENKLGKPNPKKRVMLYIRIKEDTCTLSLDTSGERLHKRGSRKHIGVAPLRETIAASLIQMVEKGPALDDTRPVEVIDPMMGSGTFLLEARDRDKKIESREFGFEHFGDHKVTAPDYKTKHAIEKLIGYEVDAKACEAAKANGVTGIHRQDFFKADPLPETQNQRWLFCNPPYGERIKVKESLAELYVRLFAACESVVRPDYACFILPTKAVKGKFALPSDWKVLEKRPFQNGGLPVTAFVFGRKS